MTITEFLLARISEDEAVALKASEQIGQRWCGGGGELRTLAHGDPRATEPCWLQVAKMGSEYGPHGRPAEWETGWWPRVDAFTHMARHDPARVLAECAAKRRIIEECEVFYEDGLADGKPVTSGATLALNVLSALAEAYAHHPDFDHAWTDGDGLRAL